MDHIKKVRPGREPKHTVVYEGKTYSLPKLSKIVGVSHHVLRRRLLRDGMSLTDALSKPVKGTRDKRITPHGYVAKVYKGYKVLEHIELAENALGRKLPKGCEVHHFDGDGTNNDPSNLVLCPDHAYHALLHLRQNALEETGNPNLRKCEICHVYDDPNAMYKRPQRSAWFHRECNAEYGRRFRAKQKLRSN